MDDVEAQAAAAPPLTSSFKPEVSFFVNERGLTLQTYAWRASALRANAFNEPASTNTNNKSTSSPESPTGTPPPAAIVVFVHGYCVHARYECLQPDHPGAPGHTRYDGSLTQRLNEIGCDVHAFDLQGHGESERYKGRRCYASDTDDYARDAVAFVRLVRAKYRKTAVTKQAPPLFLMGASMGGLLAVRALQLTAEASPEREGGDVASGASLGLTGAILIAPALMFKDEHNYCCWWWLKVSSHYLGFPPLPSTLPSPALPSSRPSLSFIFFCSVFQKGRFRSREAKGCRPSTFF